MQMRHGFAGVRAVVEDEPKTILREAQFLRDFARLEHQVAENLVILRRRFGDAGNGFLRDQQNVRRGLRVDVAKRDDEVVFINNLRRDFARDDFFKQGLVHTLSSGRRIGDRGAWLDRSFDHQAALEIVRVNAETHAQVIHDLVLQILAARAPAAGPGQMFYAAAQTAKPDHPR